MYTPTVWASPAESAGHRIMLQAVGASFHALPLGSPVDIADGFRVVLRSRALLTVLVVWNIVTLGVGAINVAEVALAVVLLIGSGLMIRTFQSMRRVQPWPASITSSKRLVNAR